MCQLFLYRIKIKTCKYDGTWGDVANCDATGYVCDVNKNACVPSADQSECVNGTKKCVDVGALTVLPKSYHTCVDGKWSTSTATCAGGGNCAGAAGSAECTGGTVIADCTLGAIQCVDAGTSKSYRTCIQLKGGTGWSAETQDCATSCQTNNGQSACADCTQGQTQCSDESGIQTCASTGTWGTAASCPAGTPICIDSNNAAKCVQCKAGDKRCGAQNAAQTNTEVQACNEDNNWHTQKTCAIENKTCDPQSVACVAKCTNGEGRCNDDGSFDYCNKGTWETLAQCGAKDNCVEKADNTNGNTFGCNCAESSTKCDAENSAVLTCKKTQIYAAAGGNAKSYTSWEVSETCAEGLCNQEDETKTAYCKCTEHEFKCDGKELKVCLAGDWKAQLTCSTEETCNADLGSCNSQCYGSKGSIGADTTAQCSGNNVISCVSDGSNVNASGMYEIKETCADNKYCAGTDDIVICTNPALTSVAKDVYRCSSNLKSVEKYEKSKTPGSLTGEWKTDKTCKANQVCMMKKEGFGILQTLNASCETKVCDELAVGCQNDTTIGMCVNNAWTTVGVCGDNGKCQDGKCVSTIK